MPRLSSDWTRLPHKRSVRFTFDTATNALTREWAPKPPTTRREFNRVQEGYRAARGAFLAELALGRNVLVIE
jgi:hypothetical protein